MRLRLTIFLLVANAILFLAIWRLESNANSPIVSSVDNVSFTRLEISGKNMGKPRVLTLENNKWRIISPIKWTANAYAVNRIRTQLDFLSKETSFPLSELKKFGHTMSEYGLDSPLFSITYGNGKTSNTVSVGKNAPIGNRVYMFDKNAKKIIVVDAEFVEGLILDLERLRDQRVFDIPRFEVSAFAVRLPQSSDQGGSGNFKRIGLAKDGHNWKFETPISVPADKREVEAFLNNICQLSARSFDVDPRDDKGFALIPTTITLQGTNRSRVLMLGAKTKDEKQIYAKLEDNPTIFTLDANILDTLSNLQNTLRDRRIVDLSPAEIDTIDISKNGKTLKLRKLTGGVWDVIGTGERGETLTAKADLAKVTELVGKLSSLRARDFVSDIPEYEAKRYGMSADSLKIVMTSSDQRSRALTIGSQYKYGGATLNYAKTDATASVFGISRDIAQSASTDFAKYRSRIFEALPEKAKIASMKILEFPSKKVVFQIDSENGDFSKSLSALRARETSAATTLAKFARTFVVREYSKFKYSDSGAQLENGKIEPWVYVLQAEIEIPTSETNSSKYTKDWKLTKFLGGTKMLGGSDRTKDVFELSTNLVDALRELTLERKEPADLKINPPVPADSSKMSAQNPFKNTSQSSPSASQMPSKPAVK